MPSLQVKDILDHIRNYHQTLAERLETLKPHQSNQRTQLLLDYMARHEINFEKTLAGYKKDAAEEILDTWIKYVPARTLDESLAHLDFHDEMPADEIVSVVMSFDRSLISLYRELVSETSVPRVQELFESILDLQERKDRQISIGLLEMSDD